MRALIYHGPMAMTVEEVDDPRPGPNDVLLGIEAVGICGSDVHGYAGDTGRRRPGMVMGHEAVGRIREVGEAVIDTSCGLGQLVTFNPVIGCGTCDSCQLGAANLCWQREVIGVDSRYGGAYAELITVPASSVVPLSCSPPAGALVEPLAVGLHAVRRVGLRAGEDLAVLGAGMIGLACAVAAIRDGASSVYIGDLQEAKIALADNLGARGLLLQERTLDEALAAVGVNTVDRAIDAIGISQTLAAALKVTRRDGNVCLVGMASPNPVLPAYSLVTDERTLIGTFCYTTQHFAEAAQALQAGEVDASVFIDTEVGLEEAPKVFEELATERRVSTKTIIRPSQ